MPFLRAFIQNVGRAVRALRTMERAARPTQILLTMEQQLAHLEKSGRRYCRHDVILNSALLHTGYYLLTYR